MASRGEETDLDRRLPRLAPGWEEQAAALSPTEGFLLSRIDGHTPWAVLRQIGGLSPEEVDLVLESWLKTGLVEMGEAPPARAVEQSPRGTQVEAVAEPDPAAAIDPELELDVELQQRIVDFEARLSDTGYHEILGVDRSSDERQIKRAYFELSKQFHPDRYFRRRIGDHAQRLDRIFKHVALAYELLSNPDTRSEIERSLASEVPNAEGAYRDAGAGQSESVRPERPRGGYRAPTRMENLQRLRKRFQMPKKLVTERRFKARQFFQSAQVAVHEKNWLQAASSARLAIAFDPWNPEYKERFAEIQGEVHAARARDLLEQAEGVGVESEALKLLEEAIHYRPADARLHAQAARLALEASDLERALEYSEHACDLEPDLAGNHLLRCRALRKAGRIQAAEQSLAKAAELAPRDPDVNTERKLLRKSKRR